MKKVAVEAQTVAAEAQVALERSEKVRKYLMGGGVREIVGKIFASDDYIAEVAKLVPKLQAMGRVTLLRELQREYMPGRNVEDLPGYVEDAVEASNAAFVEIQNDLRESYILEKLTARPDMGVEEIRALQMPKR